MADLKELHGGCLRALKECVAQANKTYALMDALEFPVSQEKCLAILDQRLLENAAQEGYQISRQHFFEALKALD